MIPLRLVLAGLLMGLQLMVTGSTVVYRGRVVDAGSQHAISDAMVTLGGTVVRTGADGSFEVRGPDGPLGVRAYGYGRRSLTGAEFNRAGSVVALQPFHPQALYLSSYGYANHALREAAFAIAEHSPVNALVIDIKGDRGEVAYPSRVPLAITAGAERHPVLGDLAQVTSTLHARGLYAIARIVTFKDNELAQARPDLAVHTRGGEVWHDREGMAWTDAFRREVWEYNAALAAEAAQAGFDEVQFDYVRFPDARDLQFTAASTQPARVAAIADFLETARQKLAPYNVFLAADVFGYVCWNLDDTGIGQTLASALPHLDYLSPMLYPSTFQFGIPGYRDPVANPYEVVLLSLRRAVERTGVPPVRFRPWIQAFKDYAFDRRVFGPVQIKAQVEAAAASGSDGWMFWNPRNEYDAAAYAELQQ